MGSHMTTQIKPDSSGPTRRVENSSILMSLRNGSPGSLENRIRNRFCRTTRKTRATGACPLFSCAGPVKTTRRQTSPNPNSMDPRARSCRGSMRLDAGSCRIRPRRRWKRPKRPYRHRRRRRNRRPVSRSNYSRGWKPSKADIGPTDTFRCGVSEGDLRFLLRLRH